MLRRCLVFASLLTACGGGGSPPPANGHVLECAEATVSDVDTVRLASPGTLLVTYGGNSVWLREQGSHILRGYALEGGIVREAGAFETGEFATAIPQGQDLTLIDDAGGTLVVRRMRADGSMRAQWSMPCAHHQRDSGASVEDVVVVLCREDDGSALEVGVNSYTGTELWRNTHAPFVVGISGGMMLEYGRRPEHDTPAQGRLVRPTTREPVRELGVIELVPGGWIRHDVGMRRVAVGRAAQPEVAHFGTTVGLTPMSVWTSLEPETDEGWVLVERELETGRVLRRLCLPLGYRVAMSNNRLVVRSADDVAVLDGDVFRRPRALRSTPTTRLAVIVLDGAVLVAEVEVAPPFAVRQYHVMFLRSRSE